MEYLDFDVFQNASEMKHLSIYEYNEHKMLESICTLQVNGVLCT